MYLIELLRNWPCTVNGNWRDVVIRKVTEHPARAEAGSLFVARKGASYDGHHAINEAITNGADAVVIDRPVSSAMISAWSAAGTAVITVPDSSRFLSFCAAELAGNPSHDLKVIAVTGTNGKTTVTHFIGQLLGGMGVPAAVIGTTGCYIGGERLDIDIPPLTTLTAEYLHPLLSECRARGVTHAALEASSIGLEKGRLTDCGIDIGILLNIGADHFEDHGGRSGYIAAKKLLCSLSDQMIVNEEDAVCMEMTACCEVPVHRFSRDRFLDQSIDGDTAARLPAGLHNRLNAMAAASAVRLLGFPAEAISRSLGSLTLPPGRLQLAEQYSRKVYIDYAHSPDALEAVLKAVTGLNPRKLVCVFGCGGNRDREKRPLMGKIAEQYCDHVIVTADNPRDEDPAVIAQHILAGVEKPHRFTVELDRRKAIRQAVSMSEPDDIVIIAGKGHEAVQIVNQDRFSLSDYSEAVAALDAIRSHTRT
ncbi:UDP-N-acetylmuramoyl-L-alanyl-D-glutamate--2,6-diaminopimelate ligase [Sporosarcina sp. NCCP-2716]|uniref:Mur ligase family protein n=1 Tax=Sporosarcina sp. NCCP-2716 TaxID=2943679 RepID=UPI00203EE81B|nr:UDP-N-acetylmuramoyl-L-alanyl-D-glutamate--2,6-diaminopimelate ligase [Sporosarcina sp. NCCP-2716]GKV67691.1 UDP-N-acetylmuramoyl-L-alanyl-D-glutamate--2,6-diaminopimelate ligase [Sporosarcina sp. NCCP-2716]